MQINFATENTEIQGETNRQFSVLRIQIRPAAAEILKKLNTLAIFNEGVSLFLNKSFSEANIAFKKVIETDPGGHTAKFFYRNTKKIIDEGVFENGAGIVAMHEK